MTPRARHRLKLTGIVSSATIVVGALGMLANGVLDLDAKSRVNGNSVVAVNATLIEVVSRQNALEKDLRRMKRALGLKPARRDTLAVPLMAAREEGLVRRIFRLLF